MKKNIYFLSLFVLMITLGSSCQLDNGMGADDCIDCPIPPKKPKPPTDPQDPQPPVNRYQLGYDTGKGDANSLFESTYVKVQCEVGPQEGAPAPTCPCFSTTDSQKTAFYQFIIDYRLALQAKIDNGIDVQFNQGLLDGFNYQILYIKVANCISNIPT